MPLLIIAKLNTISTFDGKILLSLAVKVPDTLSSRYPQLFRSAISSTEPHYYIYVRTYVDRFYNEHGEVVKEYKQLFELRLVPVHLFGLGYVYYLDFFKISRRRHTRWLLC